jgi:hypothetical protein
MEGVGIWAYCIYTVFFANLIVKDVLSQSRSDTIPLQHAERYTLSYSLVCSAVCCVQPAQPPLAHDQCAQTLSSPHNLH